MSSCTSCSSNEAPYLNKAGQLSERVILGTSPLIGIGGLLTVNLEASRQYSPSADLELNFETIKGGKKVLTVHQGRAILGFKAKKDSFDGESTPSDDASSMLRQESQTITITNHRAQLESVYECKAGVGVWRLKTMRRMDFSCISLDCEYNENGSLKSVTLPGRMIYRFIYHSNGLLASVTGPDGEITSFEWNDAKRIKRLVTLMPPTHPLYPAKPEDYRIKVGENFVSRDIACGYDGKGELNSLITTNGDKFTVEHISGKDSKTGYNTQMTIFTRPDGSRDYRTDYWGKRHKRMTEFGSIVQDSDKKDVKKVARVVRKFQTDAEGSDQAYNDSAEEDFDAKEESPNKIKRNAFGQVVAETYADGTSMTYDYDKSGRLVAKTDELGQKTCYEFDANGHPTSILFPGGIAIRRGYNAQGIPAEVTNKDGSVTKYVWDDKLRLTAMSSPGGIRTEWSYKGFQRIPFSKNISAADGKSNYRFSYSFSPMGRLTRIDYPDGTAESWKYNCCNIIEATDRANAVTKYAYNGRGEKVLEVSPGGMRTTFIYDTLQRLVKTIYPDGTFNETTYGENSKVASETYRNGQSVSFVYNKNGSKVRDNWSDGTFSEFKYDKRNRLVAVSGNHQRNIEYVYDRKGRIMSECDFGLPRAGKPRVTSYAYNRAGRIWKQTMPDGSSVESIYNSLSHRVEERLANGILVHYRLDAFGRVIAVSKIPESEFKAANTDKEKVALYEKYVIEERCYDVFGNLYETRDRDGHLMIRSVYRPDGQLEYTFHPVSSTGAVKESYVYNYGTDGVITQTSYRKFIENPTLAKNDWNGALGNDDQGIAMWKSARMGYRSAWTEDAFGNRTEDRYDPTTGRLVARLRDGKLIAEYDYDQYGREVEKHDILGRVYKTIYDKGGRIAGKILPDGSKSEMVFDQLGQLIKRDGAVDYPLTIAYSPFEELNSYTDANGATTRFEYDNGGRLIKRLRADGSMVENQYDVNGRIILKLEAGRINRYAYNAIGRCIKTDSRQANLDGSATGSSIKLEYDAIGRPIKVSDSNGTTELAYDRFGHIIMEKSSVGTVESNYNAKGLLAEKVCKINGQTISFSTKYLYDEFDRVAKVISPAGEYSYSYDVNGRVASQQGPGYVENRTYDKVGRLVAKTLNGKMFCSYGYDVMNRRVSAEVNSIKWEYHYDQLGQLIAAKSSDGKSYNYAYDKIGNRLTDRGQSYSFNKLNQLTSPGFTYDEYGNLTAANNGWKYTWDARNQLVKAEKDNQRVEFAYDFQSRRIVRKVYNNGKLTVDERFLFDGFNMTVKVDLLKGASGVAHFAWNKQELLSTSGADNQALSYVKDGNRNVIELVAKDGSVATQYAYSPFGENIPVTAKDDTNPYRFSSEQWDDTLNLAYYNYRYYSPVVGRWLSLDPILERGGANLYAFAVNNPVTSWDVRGAWVGSTHSEMTTTAFNQTLPAKYNTSKNQSILNAILGKITTANVNTDSGNTANADEYHFTRPYLVLGNDTDPAYIATWINSYQSSLSERNNNFNVALQTIDYASCSSALNILGTMSHSWQDYYAHGISINNTTLLDDVGPISGDPLFIGSDIKPASFSWPYVLVCEHGPTEPGWRASDSDTRRAGSVSFTAGQYDDYLANTWFPKCWCSFKKH